MRTNKTVQAHLRVAGVALFLLILVGYTLFQARNLIFGPRLSIDSPSDGASITASMIDVSGKAENIVRISLNGRPISIDETGYFSERLLLPPGYTIMTVRVEDRFGRTEEKTLHVVQNRL